MRIHLIISKFYRLAVPVLLALMLSDCATTSSSKRAVSENFSNQRVIAANYPDDRFLLGWGRGDTQAQAASDALAQLSNRFAVVVSGRHANALDRVADAGLPAAALGMRRAQVAEQWQEHQHRALAIIDRRLARNDLSSGINQLDGAIALANDSQLNSEQPLQRASAAQWLLDLLERRQALQLSLAVIDSVAAELMAPSAPHSRYIRRARQAKSSLKIAVTAASDEARQMQRFLENALSGTGVGVQRMALRPRYRLIADLAVAPMTEVGGNKSLKARLDLTLADSEAGVVLASCRQVVEQISPDARFARMGLASHIKRIAEAQARLIVLYPDHRPCEDVR
jgi:hypothetical protein